MADIIIDLIAVGVIAASAVLVGFTLITHAAIKRELREFKKER
jgi:hypothetical protein